MQALWLETATSPLLALSPGREMGLSHVGK